MKKILSMLLVLSMLFVCNVALAENMGVQVIGGPEVETESVSLDDLGLNVEAKIDNWGILKLTSYEVQDFLGFYGVGQKAPSLEGYCFSGEDADFVFLYADIVNVSKSTKNYLEKVAVEVVYDDSYEFAGWAFQRDYNNQATSSAGWSLGSYAPIDLNKQNVRWAINDADEFAIMPMYEGHYIFGCTLPNSVIKSTAPLRMIITIDGNEITYNIRK